MVGTGLQDSRLQLGLILGRKYQLLAELGSGGFGRVYLARHLSLGSSVAIKVGRSTSRNEALLNEARVAARLASPYSVRIYDVGACPSGAPYIVMERLNGQPLQDYLLHVGPVPTEQALGWCLNVCEALAEAHGNGLVHCDIKPSNLFLVQTPSGEQIVRLTDFGLAKQLTDELDPCSHPGELAGTPAYMSPERLRLGRATVASDVWSLGIVLFEMLTGKRPFSGRNPREIAAAIALEPAPNATSVMPELPGVVDVIIGRCLRKRPEERYPSVRDLAGALELALGEVQSTGVHWVTDHRSLRAEAPATESLTLRFAAASRSASLVWYGAASTVVVLGAVGLWRLVTSTGDNSHPLTEGPQTLLSNTSGQAPDSVGVTGVERSLDRPSRSTLPLQQAQAPSPPLPSTLQGAARTSSQQVSKSKRKAAGGTNRRPSAPSKPGLAFEQRPRGTHVAPDFILEPDF